VTEHYDVIIVGSGAGGGTLAHTLAPSGKRILLLERGDFLPRETDNSDPGSVFVDGTYISADTWYDADGKPFQPQVHYADVIAVRPLLDQPNVTLLVNAEVQRLETDPSGGTVTSVVVTRDGKNLYMSMSVPIAGCAHQAGTCRFGTDPATSVLDENCKAHEVDNLYVVDTSFFPSIGAVNPALTAMANAIRVGEHLVSRMS
jgi:choline dehydrogenase-like flavoprotein